MASQLLRYWSLIATLVVNHLMPSVLTQTSPKLVFSLLKSGNGNELCATGDAPVPQTFVTQYQEMCEERCTDHVTGCLRYNWYVYSNGNTLCQLFASKPTKYDKVASCQHFTADKSDRPGVDKCIVDLAAWRYEDFRSPATGGYISLNGVKVAENGLEQKNYNRGVATVTLDPTQCSASNIHNHDTALNAEAFVSYLKGLPQGTIVLGFTSDDAISTSAPATDTLRQFSSISIGVIRIRAKFVFAMEIGSPAKSVVVVKNDEYFTAHARFQAQKTMAGGYTFQLIEDGLPPNASSGGNPPATVENIQPAPNLAAVPQNVAVLPDVAAVPQNVVVLPDVAAVQPDVDAERQKLNAMRFQEPVNQARFVDPGPVYRITGENTDFLLPIGR